MKKMWVLISAALIIISACMIYIVLHGVSMRAEPMISPSVIRADYENIADGLMTRLFPELQKDVYLVWGAPGDSAEFMTTLILTKKKYEARFQKAVTIIMNAETKSAEQIKDCAAPCWLVVEAQNANQLGLNEFIEAKVKPLQKNFFTLTWLPFTRHETVPTPCESEKRIENLTCLRTLTVRDSLRRMKKTDQRYFFMRRYNEQDYFLFIEQAT